MTKCLENLNSDRKIIPHARLRLDIVYFLGYDIDEELPWHSTISSTRALYGEEVFQSVFQNILSLCVQKGMVGGKRQAIDSAYVKANASMDSLVEKEILEDGAEYLNELEHEDVPKDIIRHESVMKYDRDNTTSSRSRKKSTDNHHKWKAKEYKHMPGGRTNRDPEHDHDDHLRPKFVSNHTHFSTTDKDARVSVKPGKPRQLNYSMQTSVDMDSHVITNVEAHFADRRDSECLEKVLEHTIENLSIEGLHVEQIAADTGYSSTNALKACESVNSRHVDPPFLHVDPPR